MKTKLKINPSTGIKDINPMRYTKNLLKCLYEPKKWQYGQVIAQLGFAIALIIGMTACSTIKYVPIEEKTEVKTHYVDSVRWNVRDSVVLIPKEVYHTYGDLLDTLTMETKYAKAVAFVDTTHHILNGHLESKATLEIKTHTEYKDKIVEKTDTLYLEKPVPYEVTKEVKKVPSWCWWLLALNICAFAVFSIKIYLKLKP